MDLQPVQWNAMLETAVDAARLAGRQALDQMSLVEVSVKNGSELVTEADLACQETIIQRIKADFPGHGWIAEEGQHGRPFKQPPQGAEPVWWVIDPIDGTNNFAHGMPVFTVSIAAMIEGTPVVGVIYDPCADLIFTAIQGRHAMMNGQSIYAGDDPISSFVSVGLDSHWGNALPAWLPQILLKTRFRNLGTTALQMAYVAKGSMVGTIVCVPKLWDIAAGALIAEAAGAVVTDWQGRLLWPMDLAGYDGARIPCIAANPTTHKQLLAMIKC
jgi:myo-inositol-1(or 4)-monophosphatase